MGDNGPLLPELLSDENGTCTPLITRTVYFMAIALLLDEHPMLNAAFAVTRQLKCVYNFVEPIRLKYRW